MKKTVLIILIVLSCLSIKNLIINKKDAEIKLETIQQHYNNLAIMLETEFSSGRYEVSSSNTWPSAGYIFNNVLSYCENNTTLTWDEENKSVILENVTKSDKCYVYFDKNITLADYIIANASKNELIQHTGSVGANDGNYRYTGGGYKVTEKYAEQYKSVYDVIPVKLNDNTIHKNNYWWSTDRKFYLAYQEDQTSTSLKTLLTKALDDGYVEAKDINNYVCFGASEQICPKDNLYRIIGVYGEDGSRQVKLVKAGDASKEQLGDNGSFYNSFSHDVTYIGDDAYKKDAYYWNKEGTSKQAAWTDSSLNTVNLNTNFVKYLTDLENGKWIEKIADTAWQVGGMTWQNGHRLGAKKAYDYELGDSKNDVTENAKIGLMYVSDYYYAAPQTYWSLMGYDITYQDKTIETNTDYRGAIWDNWLWDGDTEWLITPRADYTTGVAFYVVNHGGVATLGVAVGRSAVRPCFYLNSNVEYVSGDGSLNNPYRIK